MKKLFSIIAGLIFISTSASCLENDFKNTLLDVIFTKTGDANYNIELSTQKPYNEPIKVIKKTDTNYYLLLPETNSKDGSIEPVGDIINAEVKMFAYAGQDLNNGYTKINIYTSKPISLSTTLKTNPQFKTATVDNKKLAQLDNSFNKSQTPIQSANQALANKKPIVQENLTKAKIEQLPNAKSNLTKEQIEANFEAQYKARQERLGKEPAPVVKAQTKPATTQKTITKQATSAKPATVQKTVKQTTTAKPVQKTTTAVKKPVTVQNPAKTVQKSQSAPQVKQPQNAELKKEAEPQKPIEKKVEPIKQEEQKEPAILPPVNEEEPALKLPQRHIEEEAQENKEIIQEQPKKIDINKIKKIAKENKNLIAILGLILGLLMLILVFRNSKKKGNEMMEENNMQQDTNNIEVPLNEEPIEIKEEIETPQTFANEFENVSEVLDQEEPLEKQEEPQSVVSVEDTTQEEEIEEIEQEEEPYIEPELISSVEIAPNRGFMIIDQQGKKALFGYIKEDVYLLYNFREFISSNDITFRMSEKQDDKAFFIVKIDKVKLLVRVTNAEMKLELEM